LCAGAAFEPLCLLCVMGLALRSLMRIYRDWATAIPKAEDASMTPAHPSASNRATSRPSRERTDCDLRRLRSPRATWAHYLYPTALNVGHKGFVDNLLSGSLSIMSFVSVFHFLHSLRRPAHEQPRGPAGTSAVDQAWSHRGALACMIASSATSCGVYAFSRTQLAKAIAAAPEARSRGRSL